MKAYDLARLGYKITIEFRDDGYQHTLITATAAPPKDSGLPAYGCSAGVTHLEEDRFTPVLSLKLQTLAKALGNALSAAALPALEES